MKFQGQVCLTPNTSIYAWPVVKNTPKHLRWEYSFRKIRKHRLFRYQIKGYDHRVIFLLKVFLEAAFFSYRSLFHCLKRDTWVIDKNPQFLRVTYLKNSFKWQWVWGRLVNKYFSKDILREFMKDSKSLRRERKDKS